MSALQRKLFRDLKTLWVQVVTIGILLICGISVMVSSWSSYQSLEYSKSKYYEEFHFADVFAELVRAPSSLLEKVEKIPEVEWVEPRIIKEGVVDVADQTEPALGKFISWHGQNQNLNLLYLRQGRFPQKSLQTEVVVHEAFAVAHRLKLGDSLKVLLGGKQRNLVVAGIGLSPEYVYALSPTAALPDDKHFGIFWMRHSDLEAFTGMNGAFNSIQIKAVKGSSVSQLKQSLDFILEPYGSLQSYDRSKQLSNLFVEDEIRQQKVMAMLMPSIFLAVAAFILNIILSRLISLHRGQIAALKALGYSAWSLTWHYFQLVTVILIIGILPALVFGRMIGIWYAALYKDFFRFPSTDFSLSLASIFYGILAGLLPAWLGSLGALRGVFKLQPAEALRPLSPPQFQSGILEKLGLAHRFDVFSKMIFRTLLFRPFRLLMGIIGIAASLAILINGSFWKDVIDFMISRQFYEMRREDLSVRLIHPRDVNVFSEIRNLPGVLMIEGERSLGVRLNFKSFKKEISILGWDSESQLSQLLDKNGSKIIPQAGGVILSRYFELEYGIKIGQTIRLEQLSGEQKLAEIVVLGFVDDLIGQQAYAIKSDLHRWFDEKPVVDTLQLKIDPVYAESIYVALKNRPEVANVSIRSLLRKSFTETVGNMIVTFTIILFVFAVAISGAVIYNSARISFSERSWELASLRILGFSTRVTFELLFIDIGIQVFLALLPGLGLGYFLSFLSTNYIHNDTLKFPLIVNISTYAMAVLVLVVTYLLSGFFLYRNVLKLNFSEALKARE